jgi:nucleotide-binding universal stress UspA family protein
MAVRKPLLVPVDGSASSLRALSLACQRVKARRGGSVIALNVQQSMPPSRHATRSDIQDHHKRMSAEVFRKVDRVAAREKVPAKNVMTVGLAAAVIIDHATRVDADEIIMGTRGLGQIGGLLMGSVAMKVVQLAKVPVTLVK